LYAGFFDKDQSADLELNPNRKAYVHLIVGALEVNGINLESGDALMFEDESHVSIKNGRSAEVLVFDLAA
jgi:redox-sensitive bicupin YhaK (pirin superfamily)